MVEEKKIRGLEPEKKPFPAPRTSKENVLSWKIEWLSIRLRQERKWEDEEGVFSPCEDVFSRRMGTRGSARPPRASGLGSCCFVCPFPLDLVYLLSFQESSMTPTLSCSLTDYCF